MQDMIVLGEIPGTSTQLNFTEWALLSIAILLTVLFVFSISDIRRYIDTRIDRAVTKKAAEVYRHYRVG